MSPGVRGKRLPGWRLSCGVFVPALAWLMHLLGAATLSEWACLSGWGGSTTMGITTLNWLLVGLSVVSVSLAALGTVIAYRMLASVPGDPGRDASEDSTGRDLARVGFWGGTMFLVAILAECVPIFYFLTGC